MPSPGFDIGNTTKATALQAKVITGSDILDTTGETKITDEIAKVEKLLGPLTADDVDIIRCVGLNYAKHSRFTHDPKRVSGSNCRSWLTGRSEPCCFQ